jgi:hypothetical protein
MYFLAGETFHGLRLAREFLRAYPRAATAWATLAAGVLGPSPLGALKFLRVKSLAHASTPPENRAIEAGSDFGRRRTSLAHTGIGDTVDH